MNPSKPLYHVPSMTEITTTPWNGFRVASTFSGCGGSCLGYRMSGFKVVWANEFVPAAQASYKANADPACILDPRDVRTVQASEILAATGLAVGDLDVFDESPPCQAFSTAGKREKGWGQEKVYEHGARQKNETLFEEYIRLLRGLMPRMFVAENVSGLVKGTAKGMFLDILAGLKASGYRVAVKVLDAQWLGVPQQRQRVIFIGVREDLGLDPIHPKPLSYRYSVRDVLPWISKAIQDPHGQFAIQEASCRPCFAIKAGSAAHCKVDLLPPSRKVGSYAVTEVDLNAPCATITIGSPGNDHAVPHGHDRRKFTIAELKRICAFPDDFVLIGSYAQQWERLGNSVPPLMAKAIGEAVLSVLQKIPA